MKHLIYLSMALWLTVGCKDQEQPTPLEANQTFYKFTKTLSFVYIQKEHLLKHGYDQESAQLLLKNDSEVLMNYYNVLKNMYPDFENRSLQYFRNPKNNFHKNLEQAEVTFSFNPSSILEFRHDTSAEREAVYCSGSCGPASQTSIMSCHAGAMASHLYCTTQSTNDPSFCDAQLAFAKNSCCRNICPE